MRPDLGAVTCDSAVRRRRLTIGAAVAATEPEGPADDSEFTKTQAFACEPDTGACTAVEGSDVDAYGLRQISTDAFAQFVKFIGSCSLSHASAPASVTLSGAGVGRVAGAGFEPA